MPPFSHIDFYLFVTIKITQMSKATKTNERKKYTKNGGFNHLN
jgi:hypothetical protein